MNKIRGLFRYFSLKKINNAAKVFISFYTSRILGIPKISGMPLGLAIEPTTSCNLRCPQCPSGLRTFTRPTGMLETGLFQKIIDEHAPTLFHLTFYFQGEPYLNPEFFDMVKYANAKKIFVSTSTNAHYLNKENAIKTVKSGLNRLIISVDGIQQESYSLYRIGGKLSTVLDGIQAICEAKKELNSISPQIIIQNIIFKHNEKEIKDFIQLFKGMDVKIQFKTAQIYDYENGSDLIPEDLKYSRYKKQNVSNYKIKNPHFNHCWKMWHSSVITWDGKVIPCCFDKDAHYKLGDLNQNTFESVWKSSAYNKFRKQLLNNRKEIDICTNCTEGSKVFI